MRLFDRLKHLFISGKPKTVASVQSSTKEHPDPRDVYASVLLRINTELENGRDIAYTVLQHRENDNAFVQIIRCKRECNGALLNFAYHHQKAPSQLLSEANVGFPTDCHLVKWEPMKNAIYEWTTYPSHERMADVIEDLFTKVLGASSDFVVKGEVWVCDMPGES